MRRIEKYKKPPGRPPLSPQPLLFPPDVIHPPHAEMKHTEEADALVPEFAARWRANREHLNKLYSTKYEKKESREKVTYSSTSQ